MTHQQTTKSNYFLGALIDAVAPLATYFVLHALGVSALGALILGSLVAILSTVINTVRRKRLDGVGVLVIVEIAASIALQFVMRDPRLLLIKPSFYSAIGAGYLFITAFYGRPLTYQGVKAMAAKGGPERAAACERAWERSAAFRTAIRVSTIGWGIAFLADAVLRVILVYALPIERAVWLSNLPHLAAIVLLIGFSAFMGRTTKRLVEEQMEVER